MERERLRCFGLMSGSGRGDIDAIGDLSSSSAEETIDATGRVIAPGFIDVHIHSETNLIDESCPHRYGGLLQGVTTQLMAPDGFGWAGLPFDRARSLWESTEFAYGPADLDFAWPEPEDYLALYRGRTPANVLPQVPHLAVRMAVMGWDARPATDAEIEQMKPLVQAWMDAGAVAFNTGLDYQPASEADTRELIELSKVAAANGGIYAAHVRYADAGQEGAWRETFEISEKAGIPIHFSHEHVTEETSPLLDEADGRFDLSFESYMYPAGCTHLAMMLPTWAQAGGPERTRQRLIEQERIDEIRAFLDEKLTGAGVHGRPVFARTQTGRYIGMSLEEAAASEGRPVTDFAIQTIIDEHPYALMVYHVNMTQDEVDIRTRNTIQHPRMMVASDGMYHGEFGHPRGYGCFARVLRYAVRELGAVSLEEAVWKMSGFPAERFKVPERGRITDGYAADLVIFDPENVADGSTWDEPFAPAVGIDAVMVDGVLVVDHGTPTGDNPGQVLARA